MDAGQAPALSFWDHLDQLRGVIIRSLTVTLACAVLAFIFKDWLFAAVFAPNSPDFITYGWLERLTALAGTPMEPPVVVEIINVGLARQFTAHLQAAMCAGVLCAAPYVLWQLFRFAEPALYRHERSMALRMVGWGYAMFMLGVAVGYLVIFPVTLQFLGTYQVSAQVANLISLDSYMGTLVMLCLCLGIIFEMPVLTWLLARMGIVAAGPMRRYRRHAIVGILTAAAIITPTADAFTLLLVSLPMWLLYEAGILIAARTAPHTS